LSAPDPEAVEIRRPTKPVEPVCLEPGQPDCPAFGPPGGEPGSASRQAGARPHPTGSRGIQQLEYQEARLPGSLATRSLRLPGDAAEARDAAALHCGGRENL
jgi:hypothetical protein